MGSRVQDADATTPPLPAGYLRDPYPFFAEMRKGPGVFRGTVMDYSKTPESLRPALEYAAVSFDAANKVLRDGRVFNSKIYDSTIGVFIGPTLLAMEGKAHWDHRNLLDALGRNLKSIDTVAPGGLHSLGRGRW